ncbi:hypothetical protein [Streptomyces sp. NPDC002402]
MIPWNGREGPEDDAEERLAAAHRAIRIREKWIGPFPTPAPAYGKPVAAQGRIGP